MDYLEEIAKVEKQIEELQMEAEMVEDDWLDEYEREERLIEIDYEIEELEEEIESLESWYEDWEYDRGNEWKRNGVSMSDFI